MTLLSSLEHALQQETSVLEREVQFEYPSYPGGHGGKTESERQTHTKVTFHVASKNPFYCLDEKAVKGLNDLTEEVLKEMGIEIKPGTVCPRVFGCVRLDPLSSKREYVLAVGDEIVRTGVVQQEGYVRGAKIMKISDEDPRREIIMLCPEIILYEKIGKRTTAQGERYSVSEEFKDETKNLFKDEVNPFRETESAHLGNVYFDTCTHPLLRKMKVIIYPAEDYFKKAWNLPRDWKMGANAEERDAIRDAHLEMGSSYFVRENHDTKDIGRILVWLYNAFF